MIRLAVLKRPFLAWILASIGARCTAQCDGAESGAPKAPKPLRYADCDKSDSALVAGKSAERSLNPNTRALSYVAGGRTNKFQSGLSEDTQSMTMQACPCATRSVSRKKAPRRMLAGLLPAGPKLRNHKKEMLETYARKHVRSFLPSAGRRMRQTMAQHWSIPVFLGRRRPDMNRVELTAGGLREQSDEICSSIFSRVPVPPLSAGKLFGVVRAWFGESTVEGVGVLCGGTRPERPTGPTNRPTAQPPDRPADRPTTRPHLRLLGATVPWRGAVTRCPLQ